MAEGKVQEQADEYEQDLHPDDRAGQHAGVADVPMRTAYDIKELHNRLQGFRDDALRQIPVLASGARLEQGGVYLDLQQRENGAFTAMGDMMAEPGHFLVPKSQTDYVLWNRLIGVENPERLDQAGG